MLRIAAEVSPPMDPGAGVEPASSDGQSLALPIELPHLIGRQKCRLMDRFVRKPSALLHFLNSFTRGSFEEAETLLAVWTYVDRT